jgi:hypothetical protein
MYGFREVGHGTWRAKAACVGLPPEWFFPPRGPFPTEQYVVCNSCPVIMECLLTALRMETNDTPLGVCGGTSRRMRKQIKQALLPRSPESLSVGELAIFMATWQQPKSAASPEVPKHEGDNKQDYPDPATNH